MKTTLCMLLVLLSSCGYHSGQGVVTSRYSTITIPYVAGDEYGEFTASLVREMSTTGSLEYKRGCADLSLNVSIINYNYDNIGFRYDRKNDGDLTTWIIPTETRVQAIAEVSVTECGTGTLVMGPVQIRAFLDFDHDYYYSRHNINEFSMGQLTDYDAAVDGSFKPLYDILAHKIADYIYDAW